MDGADRAVEIDGRSIHLRPWTLADHLDALEVALMPGAAPSALDVWRFAMTVLRSAASIEDEAAEGLEELALWWALGGPERAAPGTLGDDGLVVLRRGYARLRPWTWRERQIVLSARISLVDGQLTSADPVGVLRGQLQASVIEVVIDGERRPSETVTGSDLHTLIDAVLRMNSGAEPGLDLIRPELAAATLRICRAYGWTPTQVDAAPAAEIEAMLRLLDAATPSPVPQAPRVSGLARFPDAVIIEIEGP